LHLPPIPTTDLSPVVLGSCQPCPPSEEHFASPVVLEIQRRRCAMGICPDDEVRVHRDGTTEFLGRSAVAAGGYCVGHMEPLRLQRLLDAAGALKTAPDGSFADDSNAVFVRAVLPSETVTKLSYDVTQVVLFGIVEQLEAGLGIEKWNRYDESGGAKGYGGGPDRPRRWRFPPPRTLP
jgi:hypothetical protein